MSLRNIVLVICACLVTALWGREQPAQAHQQWVLPTFFTNESQDKSVWLGFDHALGDRRFSPSVGPGPALLWVVGPDDQRESPSGVHVGKTRTVGEIELTNPGTYRLEAEEPEAHWTQIKDGEKKRWLRAPHDQVEGRTIVKSKRYWAKAIAYVTFRTRTTGPLAAQNDPLELVPRDHPNDIRARKPFQLTVLASGKPLANRKVEVYADNSSGHDAAFTCTSRSDGTCNLVFPDSGRYLMRVHNEIDATGDPKADAYSHTVFLMVAVKPSARRGKPRRK